MIITLLHQKRLLPIAAVFCAAVVWFCWLTHGRGIGICPAPCTDGHDYVFTAAYFWHQLTDYITAEPPATAHWGKFLSTVPFRQIGVGSVYVFTKLIAGEDAFLRKSPYIMIALFAAAYTALVYVVRKQTGDVVAMACLVALLLSSTADYYMLMSEPYLRLLFILMLVWYFSDPQGDIASQRMIIGLQVFTILMTHFKMQWLLLGLVISIVQAVVLIMRRDGRKFVLLIAMTAIAPVSLVAVNWLGWQQNALAPGLSLHVMWKKGDGGKEFLRESCELPALKTNPPRYCDEEIFDIHHSWGRFMDVQYPDEDLAALTATLDRFAEKTIDKSPAALWSTFKQGARKLTNFPEGSVLYGYRHLKMIIDVLAALFCLLGLGFARTRFVSFFCLMLWLIPLLGFHVSEWDPRYIKPMAGLPLIGALLCAHEIYHHLQDYWGSKATLNGNLPAKS